VAVFARSARSSGRSRAGELKSPGKPFEISKQAVWEAWEKVRANKGAPGVDGESIADFEKDLKGSLYKIWNRMSSGTYFPPPVRAVELVEGSRRIINLTRCACSSRSMRRLRACSAAHSPVGWRVMPRIRMCRFACSITARTSA
jgi:hypothetical protein